MNNFKEKLKKMGNLYSKDVWSKKKIDEATSNSSLSYMRYITTEKPKWKVFRRKEPITTYPASSVRPIKGCPCGSNAPCKQKITPKGVTIHYPQKKKKFGKFASNRRYSPPKVSANARVVPKVNVTRPKKFPTWRLDKITYDSPFFRPVATRPHPGQ